MATLKNMTRVGADVRQIARLLQAKAPEGHMLAYITPDEAKLLKSQGGSGKPHADTGIPSYEVGATGMGNDYYYDAQPVSTPVETSSLPVGVDLPPAPSAPPEAFRMEAPMAAPDYTSFAPQIAPAPLPTVNIPTLTGVTTYGPGYGKPEETATQISEPESKTLGQRYSDLAKSLGIDKNDLTRLGTAGVQALLGERAARKAAEQGQRGRKEMEALAAPYLQKGAELQRQAQAGELTPVARQQLQSAQAQAAQAASARGGVGAQQSAARVEAIRNQLLQQQNDYGMKLTSIGDQIALGAIRTGLQADQYANQLTSSYFNNIMRTLSGTPTVTQTTQTTTTGG